MAVPDPPTAPAIRLVILDDPPHDAKEVGTAASKVENRSFEILSNCIYVCGLALKEIHHCTFNHSAEPQHEEGFFCSDSDILAQAWLGPGEHRHAGESDCGRNHRGHFYFQPNFYPYFSECLLDCHCSSKSRLKSVRSHLSIH